MGILLTFLATLLVHSQGHAVQCGNSVCNSDEVCSVGIFKDGSKCVKISQEPDPEQQPVVRSTPPPRRANPGTAQDSNKSSSATQSESRSAKTSSPYICAENDALCKCYPYIQDQPVYRGCLEAQQNSVVFQEGNAACNQTYSELSSRCEEELRDTAYQCDSKNNSDMNSFTSTASQMSVALGSQSAASITAACSTMGSLMGAANAAVAAYRMMCTSAISSCRSACGELDAFIEENPNCSARSSSDNAKRCDEFVAKADEANAAIQNLVSTGQNASQCAALTAGDIQIPQICVQNPTMVGCAPVTKKDCSDPQTASTNLVCICAANPSNPQCMKGGSSDSGGSVGGGNIDMSSRGPQDSAGGGFGDLMNEPMIAHREGSNKGGAGAPDGRMGGSGQVGGSSGGGNGVAPIGGRGGAGADESKYDSSGFYGGGRGGAGGGSGGSRGGGPAGSEGSGGNYQAGAVAPDLRKFLPGGQFDPKRGLSGAGGGLDGITGPNSNIWQKIQNRYRVMSPTLLP